MPIISRKPSASMTTVGFFAMKFASGVAAVNITATATSTAITMIGTWSVMPTAVMIESIEKTRSSRMIWKIAALTVSPATFLVSNTSSLGSRLTLLWYSMVHFQTMKSHHTHHMMSPTKKQGQKNYNT